MKAWHVLVLAGSILGGCAIIAARQAYDSRYHYSNVPLGDRLTRIDRGAGTVEVYDVQRGWIDVRTR